MTEEQFKELINALTAIQESISYVSSAIEDSTRALSEDLNNIAYPKK